MGKVLTVKLPHPTKGVKIVPLIMEMNEMSRISRCLSNSFKAEQSSSKNSREKLQSVKFVSVSEAWWHRKWLFSVILRTNEFLTFYAEVVFEYHKYNPGSMNAQCGWNQNKTPELLILKLTQMNNPVDSVLFPGSESQVEIRWCVRIRARLFTVLIYSNSISPSQSKIHV